VLLREGIEGGSAGLRPVGNVAVGVDRHSVLAGRQAPDFAGNDGGRVVAGLHQSEHASDGRPGFGREGAGAACWHRKGQCCCCIVAVCIVVCWSCLMLLLFVLLLLNGY
jgi:hypothetical protein